MQPRLWSTLVTHVDEVNTSFSGVPKVTMAQTVSALLSKKKVRCMSGKLQQILGPPATVPMGQCVLKVQTISSSTRLVASLRRCIDSQRGTVVEVEAHDPDDLDHISIALLRLTYACVEMLKAFQEV